jgi:hypothetical protein
MGRWGDGRGEFARVATRGIASALLLASFGATSGCQVAGLLGVVFGGIATGRPYEPGEIATRLGPAAMRTLGCLDVGVAIATQPLLEVYVGNRCNHPERFDLSKVTIQATDEGSKRRFVSLVDPRAEIHLLHVSARERGHERVLLTDLDAADRLCFDLGDTAPEAPHADSAPLCLDRQPEGWTARQERDDQN